MCVSVCLCGYFFLSKYAEHTEWLERYSKLKQTKWTSKLILIMGYRMTVLTQGESVFEWECVYVDGSN